MAFGRKAATDSEVYSHKRVQNPLLQQRREEENDKRRRFFLKKVKQASEDKKWESRGEQVILTGPMAPFGRTMLMLT